MCLTKVLKHNPSERVLRNAGFYKDGNYMFGYKTSRSLYGPDEYLPGQNYRQMDTIRRSTIKNLMDGGLPEEKANEFVKVIYLCTMLFNGFCIVDKSNIPHRAGFFLFASYEDCLAWAQSALAQSGSDIVRVRFRPCNAHTLGLQDGFKAVVVSGMDVIEVVNDTMEE